MPSLANDDDNISEPWDSRASGSPADSSMKQLDACTHPLQQTPHTRNSTIPTPHAPATNSTPRHPCSLVVPWERRH
eukprot:12919460-Prorocentrum_lima.AAC.1